MAVTINGTTGITGNSGTLISASTIGVGGATPAASGAGITFPATQSASSDANTLDDYEEGTWTPSLGGNTTYSVQNGTYTKIGNVVFVRAYFTVSTLGTGSVRRISGLPFTTENPAPGGYVAALTVAYYDNAATSVIYPVGAVLSNNTILDMHFTTSAASGMTFTGTFFGTNTRVELSGCYRTA